MWRVFESNYNVRSIQGSHSCLLPREMNSKSRGSIVAAVTELTTRRSAVEKWIESFRPRITLSRGECFIVWQIMIDKKNFVFFLSFVWLQIFIFSIKYLFFVIIIIYPIVLIRSINFIKCFFICSRPNVNFIWNDNVMYK